MRIALPLLVLFVLWLAPHHVSAQSGQQPGYSLELYADLPGIDPNAPGDPFSVRRGSEIRYRIEATVPSSDIGRAYYFELPPGTDIMEEAGAGGEPLEVEGATLEVGEGPSGTFVTAITTSTFSRLEVSARVNDTYQGPVVAIARFRGDGPGDIGPGSSNEGVFQFDHGDGVPGQLVADTFVDMNANVVFEQDDVRQSCPVYVYEDLSGMTLPDDISSPLDARLPLSSISEVTFDEPARIPLFAGTYSVYFGGCDTPLPPSGSPVTSFELFDSPPVTRIATGSGAAMFELQTVTIKSTEISTATRAVQPVGPTATPISLTFDGWNLTWVDRADGEDSYHVEVSGSRQGVFDLPANSKSFTLLPELLASCGETYDAFFSVTARFRGAGGYPGTANLRVAVECAPVLPPNTGSGGGQPESSPSRILLFVAVGLCVFVGVALTLARRSRCSC